MLLSCRKFRNVCFFFGGGGGGLYTSCSLQQDAGMRDGPGSYLGRFRRYAGKLSKFIDATISYRSDVLQGCDQDGFVEGICMGNCVQSPNTVDCDPCCEGLHAYRPYVLMCVVCWNWLEEIL
jgi:hypothetical protein